MIKITTERTHKITPLLYGVFFEDINYGGDGGLYAELVANRSFEFYDIENKTDKHKMCWETKGNIEFEIKTESPANSTNKHYASLKGTGGIRNTGWGGGGFAAAEGDAFDFCCMIRSGNAEIAVSIEDKEGNVYGSETIHCSGDGWRRYERKITSRGETEEAFLSVELLSGSADIDYISLFPKTFRGRKNGMREDIAEAIAGLKPKFMRFPGGCIVEGRSFENMYRWKDTIGPVYERPTNWNRWQLAEYQLPGQSSGDYFQSYGIGFYEYFQFCEDIGAKPVPVLNCGMTCQWHEALTVDTDKLEPFIQDIFDLIEFANGGEESKWGAERIKMGHMEPFGLEYIAIGNEQWGREYFERYEIFAKEISRRYPDIKLITSAGWKDSGWEYELAYEYMKENKNSAYAVDEHFYKEPEWFLNNVNRYDNYDRTLPKVFIGEYAAHSSPKTEERENNWISALAEAAFLTGVERNADHIAMTCYAPLLAKRGHQQWQPDLIWFDNSHVYKTPNYYIQKLFSEYQCEYGLRYECDDASLKISCGIKDGDCIVKIVNISDEYKEIELDAGGSGANPEGEYIEVNENTADGSYIAEKFRTKLTASPKSVIIVRFAVSEISEK